jgi:hypothetical protein
MTNRRRAFEILVVAALVLFVERAAVFVGGAYFDRDLEGFLYERLFAFREAVRAGALPLWNPYPGFGEPMLGVGNAQIAYPTTWAALVVPPHVANTIIVVLHLFIGAWGVRVLAAELGVSAAGALFGAAVWAACGPVQSCSNLPNVRVGIAFLPWTWLGFARYGTRARARDAITAGLGIGACLLGGAPEAAIMAALGAPLALLSHEPRPLRRRLVGLIRVGAAAVALGTALGAVQWLPTAVLIPQSARTLFSEGVKDSWSNHPLVLAQLVLPLPFEDLPMKADLRTLLFGGREPLLLSIYMGLTLLALAACAFLGPAPRGRRLLAGIGIVSLWISMGPYGGLWTVAKHVPPFSLIRYPTRFTLLAVLPILLLAGAGLDALRQPLVGRRRTWLAAGVIVLGLAGVLGFLSWPSAPFWSYLLGAPQDIGPWSESPAIVASWRGLSAAALFAMPLAFALLWRARAAREATLAPALLGLIAAAAFVDVSLEARGLNPTVTPARLAQSPPALQLVPRTRPNRTFVVSYVDDLGLRFLGRYSPAYYRYNESPETKLRQAHDYPVDSLGAPGHDIESVAMDVTGLRSLHATRWIVGLNRAVAQPGFARFVELSGIQYVLALHDLPHEGLELLSVAQGLDGLTRTYRVKDPLPRAFAVAGVRRATGDAAFGALLDPRLDPLGTVVLADGSEAAPASAGSVRIRQLGFDAVTLEADLVRDGHVVLLEAYDPGWRATVDGRPVPVERANVTFRAVSVPAGHHTIEMRYRPLSVAVGAGISFLTVAALLFLAIASRRRAARARLAPPSP